MAADVRRVGQVPQVVLDEPQHRVGEDVVEAVVGVGVGLDEAHVVLAAVAATRPRTAARRARSAPRASPSVIAEAIHTASRCEARPVSAVTSPPLPRLTDAVVLEGDRPAVGDRTSGSRPCPATQPSQHARAKILQVVAQVARGEEVLAHVLLAAPAQRLAERGVAQDSRSARRSPRRLTTRYPEIAVLDLQRDAADVAADERPRPSTAPR